MKAVLCMRIQEGEEAIKAFELNPREWRILSISAGAQIRQRYERCVIIGDPQRRMDANDWRRFDEMTAHLSAQGCAIYRL